MLLYTLVGATGAVLGAALVLLHDVLLVCCIHTRLWVLLASLVILGHLVVCCMHAVFFCNLCLVVCYLLLGCDDCTSAMRLYLVMGLQGQYKSSDNIIMEMVFHNGP